MSEKVEPRAGDISICAYCGAINRFVDDLTQAGALSLQPCDLDKVPGMTPMDRAKIRKLAAHMKAKTWKSS